ncbi:MAG TPA: GAF domain-containing protein [Nannocystis sp.]
MARGEGGDVEAATSAVVGELEAVLADPEATWKRQLGALLELARGQEREQWELAEVLRRVTELAVETLGVERMGAWLFDADRTVLEAADVYDAATRTHTSGSRLVRGDFPNYFGLLADARVIAVRDACHDPRSAEFAGIYFAPHGVVSTLDAPVRWQGAPVGVLCCEHTGTLRSWRDDEISFIASLADAVSLAFEADRRRQAERALAQKLALIEAQQAALQRMASPVLEVWDGVLAVPLAGGFDAARRALLTDVLVAAIRERHAAFVLLDLTGVDIVGPDTAEALVRMTRAAGVCGAQCLLSGIHGEVAQTMGSLHAELRGLVTTSSLKTGLQHCLQRATRHTGAA